jgi:hypothetical protein
MLLFLPESVVQATVESGYARGGFFPCNAFQLGKQHFVHAHAECFSLFWIRSHSDFNQMASVDQLLRGVALVISSLCDIRSLWVQRRDLLFPFVLHIVTLPCVGRA